MSIISEMVRSSLQNFREAQARLRLRGATRVGRAPVVLGRPRLTSDGGSIEIGDDFFFSARPSLSHIVASGGRVSIGNGVRISYGAAISARLAVTIGDNVEIGPFLVLMDSDFHVAGDRSAADVPAAVEIESGAKLGARVTVLSGSHIGANALVLDGSVVSGNVPANTVVSGLPARPVASRPMPTDEERDVSDLPVLVMTVLGLRDLPAGSDGPSQIPEWDSLGALKIVLALEEAYDVALTEQELKSLHSVAELARAVGLARSRKEALV